jgi:hypothetical protein
MDNADPPPWTMAQHFAAGSTAIAQIRRHRMHVDPEPVCHHFDEVDPVDPIEVDVAATYRHLEPKFAAVGLEFLPDRHEAWEIIEPNQEWLEKRVPAILVAANEGGLIYRGWTWEPRGRQPINASQLQVINNRTG